MNMPKTISSMMSQSALPAIMVDGQGFVLDINQKFTEVYGYQRKMLVGEPLITIIPTNLQTSHNIGFSRFLTTQQPTILNQSVELKIRHADDTISNAIHYIIAEKKENAWVFSATIQLIKRRKDDF